MEARITSHEEAVHLSAAYAGTTDREVREPRTSAAGLLGSAASVGTHTSIAGLRTMIDASTEDAAVEGLAEAGHETEVSARCT